MNVIEETKDIEDTEEELDATEGDPVDFWEKKQRELLTSVVDYNLGTISDLVGTKAIDVSPKYQRRFRWDEDRKSLLVESFLMNVPVPPVFLNEDAYGQYSVIDGKQRLTAITDFLKGKVRLRGLKVFSDINNLTFDELPAKLQVVLKTRPTLRAIIILRQSDPDLKFEVFRRLNTGGVHLNAQEIRNSTYPGPLNDLILELSENKKFHRLLGIKNKSNSVIHQEMRDAEFVLRFFAFKDAWKTFSGGMMRQMDHFMQNNQKPSKMQLKKLESSFIDTLDVVEACFDDHAYQRWTPEKDSWRKQVLASLYDAQMFACIGRDATQALKKQSTIMNKYKKLFENDEFRKSIDAATNTPNLFRARVDIMNKMLDQVL